MNQVWQKKRRYCALSYSNGGNMKMELWVCYLLSLPIPHRSSHRSLIPGPALFTSLLPSYIPHTDSRPWFQDPMPHLNSSPSSLQQLRVVGMGPEPERKTRQQDGAADHQHDRGPHAGQGNKHIRVGCASEMVDMQGGVR